MIINYNGFQIFSYNYNRYFITSFNWHTTSPSILDDDDESSLTWCILKVTLCYTWVLGDKTCLGHKNGVSRDIYHLGNSMSIN